MARQSDAALRALLGMQATHEKQEAALHPVAMERAGYWFREISVPAPVPPAAADTFSQLTEAERYAVIYPDRAARIRAAGGLPADLDFGPPEPDLVRDLVLGFCPDLPAPDRQRHNGARHRHESPCQRQRLTQRHFETMERLACLAGHVPARRCMLGADAQGVAA